MGAGLVVPRGIGWRGLDGIGAIAAFGCSIGLVMWDALLPTGQRRTETGMGVLLGLAGVPLALLAAWMLGVGRFARG